MLEIKYSITPLNFSGDISFIPAIDGDIQNEDANYEEKFWDEIQSEFVDDNFNSPEAYLTMQTKKTNFHVTTAMKFDLFEGHTKITLDKSKNKITQIKRNKFVAYQVNIPVTQNKEVTLFKWAINLSSENHEKH